MAAKRAKKGIDEGYLSPGCFANSPNGTEDGMMSGKRVKENNNKSRYGIKRTIEG